MILIKTEEELKKFYPLLNNLHKSIHFTLEKSKTCLSFLDTLTSTLMGNFRLMFSTSQQIQNNTFSIPHDTPIHKKQPSIQLSLKTKMIISEENTLLKSSQIIFIHSKSFDMRGHTKKSRIIVIIPIKAKHIPSTPRR